MVERPVRGTYGSERRGVLSRMAARRCKWTMRDWIGLDWASLFLLRWAWSTSGFARGGGCWSLLVANWRAGATRVAAGRAVGRATLSNGDALLAGGTTPLASLGCRRAVPHRCCADGFPLAARMGCRGVMALRMPRILCPSDSIPSARARAAPSTLPPRFP